MKNHLSALLVAAATFSVVPATARTIASDVVRFHSGITATGQTVALQAADPALASSLEFTTYANQIGAALEKIGFKPAIAGKKADLIGLISYSQTERDVPKPRSGISIGIGGGSFGSGGGVSVGGSIPIGGSGTSTNLVRTTNLELKLQNAADAKTLWEGRATTEGKAAPESALTEVIPALIESLTTDFPGTSGKSARIKIKTDKKK
jgi:hypothetical protein